jgi:shikimate kinase
MRRIILIGYMGAGKTTIGKALSKELGLPFYDLDWYIEGRRHKTISQLFSELGEEGFRKIEYNMLHELAEFEDVIISCGGGTPCFFDNIDYMNQQGQVVYLRCEPQVLQKHLMMGKTERPLLKDKSPEQLIDYITEHLKEREPYYNKARYTLDVSLMDNYEKIKITIDKLKELLQLPVSDKQT